AVNCRRVRQRLPLREAPSLPTRERVPALAGVEHVSVRDWQAHFELRAALQADLAGRVHCQLLSALQRAVKKACRAELLDALDRRGEPERWRCWRAQRNVLGADAQQYPLLGRRRTGDGQRYVRRVA